MRARFLPPRPPAEDVWDDPEYFVSASWGWVLTAVPDPPPLAICLPVVRPGDGGVGQVRLPLRGIEHSDPTHRTPCEPVAVYR